jgi:hypothetical protein
MGMLGWWSLVTGLLNNTKAFQTACPQTKDDLLGSMLPRTSCSQFDEPGCLLQAMVAAEVAAKRRGSIVNMAHSDGSHILSGQPVTVQEKKAA